MLGIIGLIIGGAVIGALARLVMPGRQNVPIWLTIIVGIVGVLIGNWFASLLGVRDTGGIDWIRHILQVVTAVVLLLLLGGVMGRSKSSV
jgi:uncharacterized membrane protein YeaQ/YmgE (transglycosylase-associated protein family)